MSEMQINHSVEEYHYSKDPSSLTKFLKTMLWVALGISIISLISDFMQMNLLSSGTFSQAAAESNDSRQQIMGILEMVVFIITGISFLRWIHRANSNCHEFEAQDMEFTPGWSIGYYFIPFINLYKPYRAMKEIWKVSINPANWQNESGSALLGWWWALWLVYNFLGQVVFRMSMRADTISSLKASTTVSIISEIIDIPLCLVSVSLISTIYTKQERLVKKNKITHDPSVEHEVAWSENLPTTSNSTFCNEDDVYDQIAKEFETGVEDKGLWTRLFGDCDGDETKTKVLYIKKRAEHLIVAKLADMEKTTQEAPGNIDKSDKKGMERNSFWSGFFDG